MNKAAISERQPKQEEQVVTAHNGEITSHTNYFFSFLNLSFTLAAVILPFFFWSTSSIIAFFVMYTISGLGLTAGYHRLFAHHSYQVPKWLERMIAIAGYIAIQRGPIFWVSMHRLHHQYPDIEGKDPHTPKEGIFHVHFGWVQRRRNDIWDPTIYRKLVPDLVKDKLYLLMDSELSDYLTYGFYMGSAFIVGGLVGPEGSFDFYNAAAFTVWVGLMVRIALLHAFGLINSVCHLIGSRPFRTKSSDKSTNSFFVALLIFGEGWHNNHHAFPASARHGLKWYQVDFAWYNIWFLKVLGLAKNVRTPSEESLERKRRSNHKISHKEES